MTDDANKSTSLLTWRGIAACVEPPVRASVLVAVVVCVAAFAVTHVGMYHLANGADMSMAFLHLTLVPVALAGLLFGTGVGAAVGLLAGVAAYVHAMFIPADYYELTYVSTPGVVAPFLVAGVLFGVLFALVDRGVPERPRRVWALAGVSVLVAVVFNLLFYLIVLENASGLDTTYSPDSSIMSAAVFLTAPIETVAVFASGFLADGIVRGITRRQSERKLSRLFQGWLLLVVLIVLMVVESAQFIGISFSERDEADASMLSEIDYIGRQLNGHGNDAADVLDGYSLEADGYVVVVRDGVVMASNDPATPVGQTQDELLGFDPTVEGEEGMGAARLEELVAEGVAQMGAEVDGGGVELNRLHVARDGDYAILISWPLSKVYADRPITLAWTTLAVVATLIAVFLLATFLLDRVVVRRIDETNATLDRITEGDLNARVNIRDSLEFSALSAGVNSTVGALKDAIAEAEQRNAQELMTAKAIQESALPRDFPPFPDVDKFDIYASMKTAKEVGGDFYDFFLVDGGRLGFVMADVSGKGIPASLFMMTAKTQVKSYMEAGLPIGEAIDAANHQLCLGNDAGMFVTLFACVLEYETGRLTYVNAGHNPPLVMSGGQWEWLRDVSGMPLGLFDGIPYEQMERQLGTGDMIYLYTDGVTEAMNLDGELFGEDRLLETLYLYKDMNPRSVSVGIRRAITDFTKDCEQSDDITMLCLKQGVPPETKAVMILRAEVDQLVHVFNYIHAELQRRGAPKAVQNPLDIAAEELFVNVCHYAYPDATPEDPGEVRISFEYDSNPPSLTVEIADDGIPYNPLDKPDAVTPDDIADVPIGGLGILMAKRSVDSMEYRREGESNVLTFRKGW